MERSVLNSLCRVTFGNVGVFMRWLRRFPSGELAKRNLELSPPIDPRRVGAMIEVLSAFGFVETNHRHLTISQEGRRFARADLVERMTILRSKFARQTFFAAVLENLENSSDGRITREGMRQIVERSSGWQLSDSELNVIIDWGRWVELFHFDRRSGDVVLLHAVRVVVSGERSV